MYTGTSWPSGTLHLTDFVQENILLPARFAGEELFVSKIAAAVLAFLFVTALTIPMSAQLLPSGNAYAGVSYGQITNVVNSQGYKGWNGSVEAFPFSSLQHFGFVIDASGFYRRSITAYNLLAGPRLSTNMGRWRPFIQAFGGIRHIDSSGFISNPVVIDVGGGTDYKLNWKSFSWRVQVDFMRSHYLSQTQFDYRASTGLVWRF